MDQGQVDNARVQVVYTRITAPIDGRVGLRLVDPGNIVRATDANGLLVITQLQPITVIFPIPEDNLPPVLASLKAGRHMPVEAYDRGQSKKLATGSLLTMDNQVDPTTGTVRLRAVFDNKDNALFPNQFVNASLLVDVLRDTVIVPSAAIQRGSQGAFVYVVRPDSTAEVRPVTIGEIQGGSAAMSKGLNAWRACRGGRRGTFEGRREGDAEGPGQRQRAPERLMNLSRPFILRPVATTLLMAAIILAGLAAYKMLPVSALPEVDYPTIQVRTFYPGASPDVMASSVTAPLERQFGQMPGLTLMTSTSSNGSSIITLQFSLDLSLDVAEQQVQAAINAAFTYLPTDLPIPPVYSKVNPADAPILTLALTSKTLPLPQVEDLADTRFAQKISQMPGVGLVSISGGQRPAVRVQVNPTALAAYNLTLEDVRAALAAANVNQAKGSFDGPRQAYIIGANDQLFTSAEYRPLIITYRNGAPVRLSDVAEAVDDTENVRQAAWANNTPAVILNIQRQPGANVIQVVDRIKTLLPQLRSSLPSSVQVSILTDRTTTIRASVRDVQFELLLAVALVVMVIFVFLRNLSATIIPSVAVPLSLIGTFGAMYLLGFSLNNLSLMALTISTGFVVDDAIVMIENIARYIEQGEKPLQAALKGAEQIGFTILSLTISLIAVLIPLLFMSDVVGRLFREFAITLGITILFSAVVSLTLTPMMCARILKHTPEGTAGAHLSRVTAGLRPHHRLLRQDPAMGAPPAAGDAGRRGGDAGRDHPPLHDRAEGFLPRGGHGSHHRHLRGRPVGLLSRHGRIPAGHFPDDPAGPGGGKPLILYRHRRDQLDAQQREDLHQPQAACRA